MESNAPTYEKRYAAFRCCDCEQEWPELLPPMYEDLPACPYCESGPTQLVELFEPVAG